MAFFLKTKSKKKPRLMAINCPIWQPCVPPAPQPQLLLPPPLGALSFCLFSLSLSSSPASTRPSSLAEREVQYKRTAAFTRVFSCWTRERINRVCKAQNVDEPQSIQGPNCGKKFLTLASFYLAGLPVPEVAQRKSRSAGKMLWPLKQTYLFL